jgi:hypothetical protein
MKIAWYLRIGADSIDVSGERFSDRPDQRVCLQSSTLQAKQADDAVAPVHLIKSQRCNLAGTHPIDRQQHQDRAIAHVTWSVCQSGTTPARTAVTPADRSEDRDRCGQARVARPLRCCMAEKYPQRSRVAGCGGARPTLSACTDEVVIDVAWSQVRLLSIGCRAPLKELSSPASPLLDSRWAEALSSRIHATYRSSSLWNGTSINGSRYHPRYRSHDRAMSISLRPVLLPG